MLPALVSACVYYRCCVAAQLKKTNKQTFPMPLLHVCTGLEEVYHRATSSIRTIRGSLRREQQGGRVQKRAVISPATWSHRFVCLDSTDAERIPTTQAAKMVLEEAGLGEKVIKVTIDCTPEEFHAVIMSAFPKLKDGGGFELCRCAPNSRDLVPITSKVASTPKLLKRRVGNGRVYIRPLQRDLSLEVDEEDDVDGVSVNLQTMWVGGAWPFLL